MKNKLFPWVGLTFGILTGGISNYFKKHPHINKEDLSRFYELKETCKVQNRVTLTYFKEKPNEELSRSSQCVGYISYKNIGQIGSIGVRKEFRRKGIGQQMLDKAIEDLKSKDVKKVWAVTRNNHPFWSNVYNKGFTRNETTKETAQFAIYYKYI